MLILITFTLLFSPILGVQVQEHDIKFTLFNKYVTELPLTKYNLCNIDPSEDIKFLIHGKGSSSQPSWILEATEVYQQLGNSNIVQVNYTAVAGLPDDWHIYKASDASYFIAKLIRRIHKRLSYPLDRIHLIGHSLGGQVVGFIGKHVIRALHEPLGKITGLDPANDDFSFDPNSENGTQKTDALLVAVIHTDDTGIGSRGDIDFYPNGGSHPQAGCDTNICSHIRSCEFFIEALQNEESFLATKCDSYENYLNGDCEGNDQVSFGGNLLGHEGDYYFLTNPEPPYSKN